MRFALSRPLRRAARTAESKVESLEVVAHAAGPETHPATVALKIVVLVRLPLRQLMANRE
jgi:hypothetical protein